MARYRLLVEYDGTPFVGWQRQQTGTSVQGVLEQALARLCGQPVMVQCAGRTDAGVHASGQVAHVDLPREYSADAVRDAANFHAKPHPVAVLRAELVPDDFHARFSAVGRAYVYRILNRRAPSVLDKNRVWWVPVALDAARMQEGANHLLGGHDFTSFRAAACQAASPVKHLGMLDVRRDGELIEIHAAARSFLHHQVRNMVGTLKLVGEGKWHPDDVRVALEACSRAAAGPTAPPEGLYLTSVSYEESRPEFG